MKPQYINIKSLEPIFLAGLVRALLMRLDDTYEATLEELLAQPPVDVFVELDDCNKTVRLEVYSESSN